MSPLRRTPLVRRSPLSRGSGLPPTPAGLTRMAIARKRVARSPEEAHARQVVARRSNGRCEGCGAAPATDWAHRVGRAQGGLWCPANGLHLCSPGGCHAWAHANPAEARSVGWIVRRGHDPLTVPALLHGVGWAFLAADGSITPTERGAA